MTIGERLRFLRKYKLGYKNCDDFGAKIGLSGSNIRNIETGRINLTDRVISDICNVFFVNEDWLRNGNLDDDDNVIFIKLTKDEELAMYTQMLLDDTDDIVADMIKEVIIIYEKLDSDAKQVLKDTAKKLLDKIKNKEST